MKPVTTTDGSTMAWTEITRPQYCRDGRSGQRSYGGRRRPVPRAQRVEWLHRVRYGSDLSLMFVVNTGGHGDAIRV